MYRQGTFVSYKKIMKKILLVACLLLSLVGCSSSSAKYNVGVIQLIQHEALDKATQGFVDVLNEEFGDDVNIDVQNASGDSSTCLLMANNFVAENVDLIMCNATPALQAAKNATETIPVLGTSVTEYSVALGIENFNGLVGTNISGTSDLAPLDQQAQMFIDLLPNAKNIGIIYCSSEDNSIYQVKVVTDYLTSKGLNVTSYAFADTSSADQIIRNACGNSDALYVPTDNACADNGPLIAQIAEGNNVPIITGEKSTCISCNALATLSIDYYDLGRTTGEMAVRILKGEANISEMKIEYFANPVKLYSKEVADKFSVTVPSDFKEISE